MYKRYNFLVDDVSFAMYRRDMSTDTLSIYDGYDRLK